MLQFLIKMEVDENRINVLTKFSKKGGKRLKESDHNLLSLQMNIPWSIKPINLRKEIFNLKNVQNQQKFFDITNETDKFTKCFKNSSEDINTQTGKWQKILQSSIFQSFDKIRITNKSKESDVDIKIKLRLQLKHELNKAKCTLLKAILKNKIISLEEEICELSADENVALFHAFIKQAQIFISHP